MNKGKVIVTGGLGYIGSHTVVELVKAGYDPIIIDDCSNSDSSVLDRLQLILKRELNYYSGKVQDAGMLDRIFENEGKIDSAIHFAAFKAVGESVNYPLKYYSNNLESLTCLLAKMQEYNCEKIVFSSSCTVYGQPDQLPVRESTPRKPAESPYGNTKQICEDILQDQVKSSGSLKAVSLRYFNPVGAHPSSLIGELPLGTPENLVPYITQTAAGIRDKLIVFGDDYNTSDGSCVRDYIHVCDLAEAHVRAIDYLEKKPAHAFYDVFNIGIGKGYSVLELINTFEKVNGIKLKMEIGSRRQGDIEQIFADTSKANEVLGWKANRTLAEALESSWNWQKSLK